MKIWILKTNFSEKDNMPIRSKTKVLILVFLIRSHKLYGLELFILLLRFRMRSGSTCFGLHHIGKLYFGKYSATFFEIGLHFCQYFPCWALLDHFDVMSRFEILYDKGFHSSRNLTKLNWLLHILFSYSRK